MATRDKREREEPTAEDRQLVIPTGERQVAPVGGHPFVPVPEATATSADPYGGMGMHALAAHQVETLLNAVDADMLDVLPTGECYLPQIQYRRLLNKVFGPGAWGLRPIGPWTRQGKTICREWALVVGGGCVATAVGECDYIENGRMTWATAAEASKSNALMRCCKDLGIASECWDKRFTAAFLDQHCVRVKVEKRNREIAIEWRRADAKPLAGEMGLATAKRGGEDIATPRRTTDAGSRDPGADDVTDAEVVDVADEMRRATAHDDKPRVSEAQIRRLYALCKQHGVDAGPDEGEPEIGTMRYQARKMGFEHLHDIPAGRGGPYDRLSEWIIRGGV